MKCRGWDALKNNQKKGVSMAVMLCVSAFFLAFAAAILYTAGMMTSQSTERLKQERCYQLARSAAAVIDQELTRQDYTDKNSESLINTLYKFANQFLDRTQYADYDEDNDPENTQYTYVLTESDLSDLSKNIEGMDGFGNLSLTLRKEKNGNEDISSMSGSIEVKGDGSSYAEEIENIKRREVRQYSLSVDVTAYYEDAQYTYTTEYVRAETFEPLFTYQDKDIYWVNGEWREGSTAGQVVDFTAGGEIQYKFDASKTTSSRFINIQDEGGDEDEM